MKWFRDTGDLGVSSFQLRVIGRAWEGEEEEGEGGRERSGDVGIGGVRERLLGDRL